MDSREHPVEMDTRHVREQRARIERQIEMIRHLAEEGQSVDREEAFLRQMQETFEEMRVHLAQLQSRQL